MYTRQQIDRELKQILKKPYDPLILVRWANRLYLLNFEEISSELNNLLLALELMSIDEKCAYTEEKLNILADKLINKIEEVKEKLIDHITSQKKLYTRQQLGVELKQILKKSYDPTTVAKWAERLYLNTPEDISSELDDLLYTLMLMWGGDENFEYTEEQLNLLADKLMNNEENALQQVNKKFKIFEEWQPDETRDSR